MNMQAKINPFEGVPEWFPYWQNETVILVASGPSAKDVPLSLAQGKARFITINDSYRLAPWADVLYACDSAWWQKEDGAMSFKGLKLTIDRRSSVHPDWNVHKVWCDKNSDQLVTDAFNKVGWGGNSGFGAINLAVQFCVKKIILVGFDMTIEHGTHWHGDHVGYLHNPTNRSAERWRRAIDRVAPRIAAVGIEVLNCSPVSRLANYVKTSFEEAIGGL